MASTPIYNWPTPDNTDLVKNGALAIRTLGDAIDTTVDTMIPETIFAAKGDLLGASANDTPAVLTVGANGETLVADSSTATGLKWSNGAKRISYVSTVTSVTGTITTVGAVDNVYYRIGDLVFVEYDITITTLGTGGGAIKFTLPVNNNRQNSGGGVGRENNVTGLSLFSFVDTTVASLVRQYDNTFVGGNNYRYQGFISYGAA